LIDLLPRRGEKDKGRIAKPAARVLNGAGVAEADQPGVAKGIRNSAVGKRGLMCGAVLQVRFDGPLQHEARVSLPVAPRKCRATCLDLLLDNLSRDFRSKWN